MDKTGAKSRRKLKDDPRFDPNQVRDPLFQRYPEFFDARDVVQVKYEMLRAHHVKEEPVSEVARRFGFSRQTFYATDLAFKRERWQGLLPGKPGPKGPNKITPECAKFLRIQYQERSDLSWNELAQAAADKFGVSVHPRTIQRLLDKKKLPPTERV